MLPVNFTMAYIVLTRL